MARGPSLAVTWLGHATLRLALDGATILTDPALHPRMGGLIRHAAQPKPPTWHGVDAVLVSHAHHDHLDLPSLGLLDPDVHVVVPRGLGALVRGAGMRQVSEVDVGDRLTVRSVVIEVVPALHAGRRVPRGPTAPAIGYVIEGSQRVYFAGDTGLFEVMEEIGRTGLDLALLPVWGWGPRLRGGHLDPAGAANALTLLRPTHAVPIHWGTFWPAGMRWVARDRFRLPGGEFAQHAATVAPDVDITVLAPGETLSLEPRA
jgi:L-ascorbate metabolism protein UlaG (beta-lactamase superfamily)